MPGARPSRWSPPTKATGATEHEPPPLTGVAAAMVAAYNKLGANT
jgi:hypothetical protein